MAMALAMAKALIMVMVMVMPMALIISKMDSGIMIKIKLLTDTAKAPKQQREGDAGLDIYADQNAEVWPGAQAIISTGVAIALTPSFAGFIWPRSGLATRHMLDVNAGLIDSNYRGEIKVCLINHGDKMVEIKKGDRIAQLVVSPIYTRSIVVDALDDNSERGVQGFGSSGI